MIINVKGAVNMYSLANEIPYALNNAFASLEIEGYAISNTEKKLCSEVVNGKMSKQDLINLLLERCR